MKRSLYSAHQSDKCIERSNATIGAEEFSHLSSYQTLSMDKKYGEVNYHHC